MTAKRVAFGALGVVLIAWLLTWWLLGNAPDRGTIGDMFGGVNALFSGLAFAGVIIALVLQMEELKLQREELRLTRAEFRTQNDTLSRQRFENTFFQLLRLQNEIVTSIDLAARKPGYAPTVGRDCFRTFFNDFKNHFNLTSREQPLPVRIDAAYRDFYRDRQQDVGHYFRNLYNLVKFVHNSEPDSPHQYTNLVRAQLSSYELALLFYNCLSSYGREKFAPLVTKFSLLKSLPKDLLIDVAHAELYDPAAFAITTAGAVGVAEGNK